MLSTRARLRTQEVKEVLAHGVSVRSSLTAPHLSVKFLKKAGPFRAAIVMPKSTAGNAVVRNRIRRAAYRALTRVPLPRSIAAVFFVKKIPATDVSHLFEKETHTLIEKMK